jgi:hypothetical protein
VEYRGDLVAEYGEKEAGHILNAGLREYNADLVREFGEKQKPSCRTP